MKIYYGKAVYDQKEISASLKVLKNKSLTLIDGPAVKDLENKIAKSSYPNACEKAQKLTNDSTAKNIIFFIFYGESFYLSCMS